MTEPGMFDELLEWIGKSSRILIKKLSRNDCSWAEDPRKHQYGFYIPSDIRKSGFFPPLQNENLNKPHIFVSTLPTLWPATGETRISKLRHWANKGAEMHFTRVPKSEFAGLAPASLLIGGELKNPAGREHHWFATVDSASEDAELIESVFDLPADFHFQLFDPSDALRVWRDDTAQLIEELSYALKSNRLEALIASVSKLPSPAFLAASAQAEYLRLHDIEDLDPFKLPAPGDAIMKISRDIEYSLYKQVERRHRAAEVLRILVSCGGERGGTDLVAAIVKGYPALDGTFLSASQHRKSRGGRSFEQHIGRLLTDGRIPFEEQIVTGSRRPDFVLPNLKTFKSKTRSFDKALILAAKTTLRERWKQVVMERLNCGLFLATVDDRVAANTIFEMYDHGICMVVPESLKEANETCYAKMENVITFREFFDTEVRSKRLHYWK